MLKSFHHDGNGLELIDIKEFLLFKGLTEVAIRLGKTKTKKYLVIQAQFENNKTIDSFQTKLTVNNLREKSKHFKVVSNIDESYILFLNLFEIDQVWVKDIINKTILKLVFNFQNKELEINLPYKRNENNIFFHKAQTFYEPSLNNMDFNLNINENLKINEIQKDEENEENKEEKNKNVEKEKIEENQQNIIESKEKEEEKEKEKRPIENNKDKDEEKDKEKDMITSKEKEEIKEKDNIIEEEEINKEEIKGENNSSNNKESEVIFINKNENINENNKNENMENNLEIEKKKENDKIIIINEIKEENDDIENYEEEKEKEKNDNKNTINEESHDIINKENGNNNIDMNPNIECQLDNDKVEKEKIEEKVEEKEEKKEKDKVKESLNEKQRNKIINEKDNHIINENRIDINELLKKVKNLEEENKKLKEENKELKQKLSQLDINKDKLKKSEKEKENLKMELQKLKYSLNKKSTFDESRQNKITTSKLSQRQNTLLLPSKNDLFQAKPNSKKNDKGIQKIQEKKNIINIKEEEEDKEDIKEENPNKINFQSKSPINLKIHKIITHSSYLPYSLDNTFTVFTSLKNELLLVYATKIKSLECFDLIKNKFHKAILNAHNGEILTIRHYCPNYLKKDMILSGSNGDFSVKIWDVENWSCIFNISKIYEKGNMYSVCILFDEFQKENYVFTSSDSDYIKMWGMDEKFIKNIVKTNTIENYFIDTYYDSKVYKYYLISGEMRCVKSYEINLNQLFRVYIDNNSYTEHVSAFIYTQGGIVKLVEAEFYGSVRIWNFHTGNIIHKIDICRRIPLVSLCLWNENYLLVSCVDNTIKLVDFKNYALIKSFSGHNNEVCTIKKFIHPNYGECLLSQGLANEQIKMWING